MTTITIVQNHDRDGDTYRAVAGCRQSVGKTAGEALDALNNQLSDHEGPTLVIIQPMSPDRFFTAEQRKRLQELMARWRAARDGGSKLPPNEQSELEALVDAETNAAAQRAAALAAELGR